MVGAKFAFLDFHQMNYFLVVHQYCNPKEEHYGIDWSGAKNQRELHLLLEK